MRLVVNFSLLANILYKITLKYAFGIVPHEDNYNSAVHCLYSDRLHRARYDNNIIRQGVKHHIYISINNQILQLTKVLICLTNIVNKRH